MTRPMTRATMFVEPASILVDEPPRRCAALERRSRCVGVKGRVAKACGPWIVTFAAALSVWTGTAHAAGDLSRQTPLEVRVQLGDEKGSRRFVPETIELETGKLYRLILSNPSTEKHYFSSDAFSQAVYTRKVQVNGQDGNAVAEVKGFVREIEVLPKASTEWWLVPIKAGQFGDLRCPVEGHTESGMVGRILIK
jgi:uncharacterized cupredoxin-like copper-binding protein